MQLLSKTKTQDNIYDFLYLLDYYLLKNTKQWELLGSKLMKCKKQVKIKNGKEIVMKNKMKAMKGECPKCGTKVFRILGKA